MKNTKSFLEPLSKSIYKTNESQKNGRDVGYCVIKFCNIRWICIIFFTTLYSWCDRTPEARYCFCHSPLQPDDLYIHLYVSKAAEFTNSCKSCGNMPKYNQSNSLFIGMKTIRQAVPIYISSTSAQQHVNSQGNHDSHINHVFDCMAWPHVHPKLVRVAFTVNLPRAAIDYQ